MSKIYIKQKGRNYYVHENEGNETFLEGFWERKKGVKALFHDQNGAQKLEVKYGRVPWIGGPTSYLINIENNAPLEVKLINRWKSHFHFTLDKQEFNFYEHYGHKKSLYMGDQQVAKFDKATFNWGERDSGFAIFNSDQYPLLILGLWIMKDMGQSNDAELSADFGNVTSGVKQWNDRWQPSH